VNAQEGVAPDELGRSSLGNFDRAHESQRRLTTVLAAEPTCPSPQRHDEALRASGAAGGVPRRSGRVQSAARSPTGAGVHSRQARRQACRGRSAAGRMGPWRPSGSRLRSPRNRGRCRSLSVRTRVVGGGGPVLTGIGRKARPPPVRRIFAFHAVASARSRRNWAKLGGWRPGFRVGRTRMSSLGGGVRHGESGL
jgi:hypothetical protein